MDFISSKQNENIKKLKKLHSKSYRDQTNQFIAQGYRTFKTFLENKFELIELYCTDKAISKNEDELTKLNPTIISEEISSYVGTSQSPSGLIAVFEKREYPLTITSNSILLHEIQDPGNLGTLIRTAAAMNIENIFLTGNGVDPYSPKVVQSTAGTLSSIKIFKTEWEQFLKDHKSIDKCALVVQNGSSPKDLNLSKSILIVGNEGQGLPDSVIDQCNKKMTLPMPGKTESLNAATAGSIALYLKSNQ